MTLSLMNLINALTYIIIKLLFSLFFALFLEFYVDFLVSAVAHRISKPCHLHTFLAAAFHLNTIDVYLKNPLAKDYFTVA
jgi:hypothetical protein